MLQQNTADPHLHMRPSNTSRLVWCSILWGHCYFTQCLGVYARFRLCPPWVETLFPQFFGNPVTKSGWPSISDSLEFPSPFTGSPGWEAWYGPQNLHNSGRAALVLLFSVCGSPTQQVWDLILSWLHPSYLLISTSSLSLDVGYFIRRFQYFFVRGCSAVVILVFW